jgi:hypothetical protein
MTTSQHLLKLTYWCQRNKRGDLVEIATKNGLVRVKTNIFNTNEAVFIH